MATTSSSITPSQNTAQFTKLTETNYLTWLRQLKPYLHGAKLWGYVDGSIPEPSPTTRTTATDTQLARSIPNPDHDTWFTVDQQIVSILTTTLTENIAQLTIGFDTSKAIWDCLERHFSQKSVASATNLKMQLLDLNKGNQFVDEYLCHAKLIADALVSINKPVPDEDLVIATVYGLGPYYIMLRTALTQNPPLPDFTELRAQILSFDAQQSRPADSSTTTALFNHSQASSARRDHRPNTSRYFPNSGRPNNGRFRRGRHSQQQAAQQSQVAPSFPMQQQYVPPFGPFTSPAWASRPSSNGILGPAPQWCPNCHSSQHGLS